MKSPDILVNALGIAYGLMLVLAALVRVKALEPLRVDTLFMRQRASESTRPLNLVFGLLVAGYAIYSLASG